MAMELPGSHPLEREYDQAVVFETHKKNVNDAKMRAVHQKVPSYEEFEQMVLGADLKPLAKGDRGKTTLLEGLRPNDPNRFAPRETFASASLGEEGTFAQKGLSAFGRDTTMCTSGPHFEQMWRRDKTPAARFRLLEHMPAVPAEWSALFPAGLDPSVLADLVTLYAGTWAPAEGGGTTEAAPSFRPSHAAASLVGLSTTPRFALSLQLLSKKELEALSGVCEAFVGVLREPSEDGDGASDGVSEGMAEAFAEAFAEYLGSEDAEPLPMAE